MYDNILVKKYNINLLAKKLPDALIIGVRKGGTRALLDALSLHPMIKIARHELHFFDNNETYLKGINWYKNQMPLAEDNQIVIEKTPAYFTSPYAAKRIYKFNPNIKILLILRNPITRTISDFTQVYYVRQSKNLSLPELEKEAFYSGTERINKNYKPIRNSLYSIHLFSYLKYFKKNQILILNGDNFIKNPLNELKKAQKFLNLPQMIYSEQLVFNSEKGFYCFKKEEKTKVKCLGNSKGRKHVYVSKRTKKLLKKNFKQYNYELKKLFNDFDFYW
ncbi:GH20068p [Strongyloides ratti]|uniref:GH20068p n=1 Tax=Strongyloides ratti TaxID=34506 RepID=A0A090KWI3_STRRB|nr:GH20068p [Strongyloides ratti]CEF59617.1 GH20068p [Strongyloides ratti]